MLCLKLCELCAFAGNNKLSRKGAKAAKKNRSIFVESLFLRRIVLNFHFLHFLAQFFAHQTAQHSDADAGFAAFGNNNVGVAF